MEAAVDCGLAVSALSVALAVGGMHALLCVITASVVAFCLWLGALLVQHEEMRIQAAGDLMVLRAKCAELRLRGFCLCVRVTILALEWVACEFRCLSERVRNFESRACVPY